ncbi:MAG: extracellular solute-binding protein [Chloroflexi bacterium]|nr:extracellular solute-binding protein [Chloroflexota bacterium]
MDTNLTDHLATPASRRRFLRRVLVFGVAVPSASALLAACGQPAQPAAPAKSEAAAAPAKTDAAAGKPAASGAADLDQLVEVAKKEGAVVGIGNTIQMDETKKAIGKAFRARYGLPDSFKVDLLEKGLADVYKQIQEEMAAGKLTIDVPYFNTVAWFKGMASDKKLLAFDAPEYAGYSKSESKPGFVNRPYYVSDLSILASIVWNKDVIRDSFSSWFDVLRPQYKGKISIVSARTGTSVALVFKAMKESPDIGVKLFQELAKLEPTTIAKTDVVVEKVISGEYPLSLFPSSRPYGFSKLQGVKNLGQVYPKEGVAALAVPWAILADAPHPNAAKLFVNFMRSQEGQQLLADYEGRVSGRPDIKSPDPNMVPSIESIKVLPLDEANVTKEEFQALGKEWGDMFGA